MPIKWWPTNLSNVCSNVGRLAHQEPRSERAGGITPISSPRATLDLPWVTTLKIAAGNSRGCLLCNTAWMMAAQLSNKSVPCHDFWIQDWYSVQQLELCHVAIKFTVHLLSLSIIIYSSHSISQCQGSYSVIVEAAGPWCPQHGYNRWRFSVKKGTCSVELYLDYTVHSWTKATILHKWGHYKYKPRVMPQPTEIYTHKHRS